ncbi:hypothetical protein [Rhodospirillum sp. A1_3_36]|uniref:hypothetical protein n=1 Tax=Rhodospirillum sp. A1_3_36 TaxID=3391666 RepID=UPI0039A731AD
MTTTQTPLPDLRPLVNCLDMFAYPLGGMLTIFQALGHGADFSNGKNDTLITATNTGDAFEFMAWAMTQILSEHAACLEELNIVAGKMEASQ